MDTTIEKAYNYSKHSYCIAFGFDEDQLYINRFFNGYRSQSVAYCNRVRSVSILYNIDTKEILAWGVEANLKESEAKKDKNVFYVDNIFTELNVIHHRLKDFQLQENEETHYFAYKGANSGFYKSTKCPKVYKHTVHDEIIKAAVVGFLKNVLYNYLMDMGGLENDATANDYVPLPPHYAFFVPTDWDFEIRKEIIRPLFEEAGLMAKSDHDKRLLFFTQLETTFQYLQAQDPSTDLTIQTPIASGQRLVMYSLKFVEKKLSVRLDLFSAEYPALQSLGTHFIAKTINSVYFHVSLESNVNKGIEDCLKERDFKLEESKYTRLLTEMIKQYQDNGYISSTTDQKLSKMKIHCHRPFKQITGAIKRMKLTPEEYEKIQSITMEEIHKDLFSSIKDQFLKTMKEKTEPVDRAKIRTAILILIKIQDLLEDRLAYRFSSFTTWMVYNWLKDWVRYVGQQDNKAKINAQDQCKENSTKKDGDKKNANKKGGDKKGEEKEKIDPDNQDLFKKDKYDTDYQYNLMEFGKKQKIPSFEMPWTDMQEGNNLMIRDEIQLSNTHMPPSLIPRSKLDRCEVLSTFQPEYLNGSKPDPHIKDKDKHDPRLSSLESNYTTNSRPELSLVRLEGYTNAKELSTEPLDKEDEDEIAKFSQIRLKPSCIIHLDISLKIYLTIISLDAEDPTKSITTYHEECMIRPLSDFFILLSDKYQGCLLQATTKYADRNNLEKEIKDFFDQPKTTHVSPGHKPKADHIQSFLEIYLSYFTEFVKHQMGEYLETMETETIGHVVTVEKIVLDNIFGSKQNLIHLLYDRGILQKADECTISSVITQGDGLLSVIKNMIDLPLRLKSYSVMAQLHEDYVQLTLQQVVNIDPTMTIIVQDRIVPIDNVNDSLCKAVWNYIISNKEISQCENHTHKEINHRNLGVLDKYEKMSAKLKKIKSSKKKNHTVKENFNCDLFSLHNFKKVSDQLNIIFSKMLKNTKSFDMQQTVRIEFDGNCNFSMDIPYRHIIDIAIEPVMRDIATIIAASVARSDFFESYVVDYLFVLGTILNISRGSELDKMCRLIMQKVLDDSITAKAKDYKGFVIQEPFSQMLHSDQKILVQQNSVDSDETPDSNQTSIIQKKLPHIFEVVNVGHLEQVARETYAIYVKNVYKDDIIYPGEELRPFLSLININNNGASVLGGRDAAMIVLQKGQSVPSNGITQNFKMHNNYFKANEDSGEYQLELNLIRLNNLDNTKLEQIVSLDGYLYDVIDCFSIHRERAKSDTPIRLEIKHLNYNSSLQFSFRMLGDDDEYQNARLCIAIGEQLTVAFD